MRGFYSGNKPKQKQTVSEKIIADPCSVCGLEKGCHAPHMKPHGQGKLGIYMRAEGPGREEDEYFDAKNNIVGMQLIGEAGQLLREHLEPYNIDIDRDCVKDNSVRCRTPKNAKPTKTQIKCCKNFTDKTVEELKPKFIWLFGGVSLDSFYGGRFSDTSITRWRGLCIPDKRTGAWVLPMFHPSYLVRNSTDDHLRAIFEKDIKFAVSCLKKKPPQFIDWEGRAKVILKESEAIKILEQIDKTATIVFFDYETNALKPFYPGAKLYSLSLATSSEQAWSFLLTPKLMLLWRRILLNPRIKKVSHNLKFEDIWSREKLKINEIANWHWCTMNCAHVLDTRKKFTGLKFQSYINFGVDEYDKEIKPYLKPKSGYLNTIEKAPVEKVLKYGSLDSVLGMALYEKQQRLLNNKFDKRSEAFGLFKEGLVALADAELEGICTDEFYYKEQEWSLDEKIKKLEQELLTSKEAKLFKKKTGKALVLKKEFSAADLRKLFFDVLGYKATKKTAKANEDAIDAEVLHSLNNSFANKIIERRKLTKTKGTYLAQFARESFDGKMHPFFDLHTTESLRSCIAGYEKILVVRDFEESPNGIPIKDIKVGDLVYCFDDNLNPQIRKVVWSGKTGKRKIVRIYFSAKGSRKENNRPKTLDCTPEHLVRLITGKYIQAKDLLVRQHYKRTLKKQPKCRVLACHRGGDNLYFTGHNINNSGIKEHRFIYKKLIGLLKNSEVVHHINGNHFDNRIENLQKLSKTEHCRLHTKDTFCNPIVRKNNIKAVRKGWKEGKYHNSVKRGKDHPFYLNLSKLTCFRMLAKNSGKVTLAARNSDVDFGTFKYYLKKHNIDIANIKLRYDRNGVYISKGRLQKLSILGRAQVQNELGIGYYNLLELYKFYKIDIKRRWGNQFGEFKPGNHVITKVEWLDKEVDVYDIEVEDFNNFFANEICVHNSSSKPNFQNIPARDELAKAIVRRGIIPSSGNKLLCIDYGAQEIRGACFYSQDKALMKYIESGADPHYDETKSVLCMTDNQVVKPIRDWIKNQFVFPEIYGSYYGSIAPNIMENCWDLLTKEEIPLKEHLKRQGVIRNYKDINGFLRQVKKAETKFWNKFWQLREWQDKAVADYLKKGYIEMFMGFRRGGYLTRNQICNTPIQGTSFHLLLWAYVQLNKWQKKYKLKSKLIGEIHDEMIWDLDPSEEKDVIEQSIYVMKDAIRERFDWINVPLLPEVSITDVNQSWYYKKGVK